MEPHFSQVGILVSLNTSHHNNSQHKAVVEIFGEK